MRHASEKGFCLPQTGDRQSNDGRLGSRLLPLAAAVLITLLLPATASALGVAGYTQVQSAAIPAAAGQDVFGQATCPAGTVPQGGGVFVSSGDVHASVNSSYPDPNGISWDGYANNGSTSSTTAWVWAVCAAPNAGYTQVVSASTANPPGTQSPATANCPAGTEVLGGGARASSQDLAVDMNSTYPAGTTGWQVNMNNGSGASQSFDVYAVCSNPFDGYGIIVGPTNSNSSQNSVRADCPSGQQTLGGGVAASSTATSVNINTTFPSGSAWLSWENNAGTSPDTITPYATCANPASYVRPRGATPIRVSLVPAYQACTSPGNTTHGAPLKYGSCAPPVQASPYLTIGTPDAAANGAAANAVGSVHYRVKINADPTPNDVLIDIRTTDVRCEPVEAACGSANAAGGPDYTGQLQATESVRITDKLNGLGANEQGTVRDTSFPVTVPCATTADTSIGSTCAVSTSADAEVPGSTQTENAIWQLGQVQVFDGGVQGVAGSKDANLFEDQGVFVP